jgi:branched-chain amino acid transport system permease protein
MTESKNSEHRQNEIWHRVITGLRRAGFSPLGLFMLILIAVLPLIPPFNQEHMIRWFITGAFFAAQAAAFDFTGGFINVVNFGFAAFVGLGAYTSAVLANEQSYLIVQPGISPWIGIWIGALLAGLVGLGLGVLTLRLRGIYAAVMAWFVGIALMGIARNWTGLTRGPLGLHPPSLLESPDNLPYYYIILFMMIVTYITLKLIVGTRMGLAFKALGQNLDAARASGINPTLYRVTNFAISCAFAGWLGGFYAHYIGSLTPETMMHTSRTVEVLVLVFIGGRGSMWGGMFVAFPFVFFLEFLRSNLTDLPGLHLVIYGLLMMLVMIYYPAGFAGFFDWAKAKAVNLWTALVKDKRPAES